MELQPDEEIIIPQDDLYSITWEADFGAQLESRSCAPNPTYLPSGEQPVTSNNEPSDANEKNVDYITTQNCLHNVNETTEQREQRLNDDVTKRNEATDATRNVYSD